MNATLLQPRGNLLRPSLRIKPRQVDMQNRRCLPIVRSVVADNGVEAPSSVPPQSITTDYRDSWFDRLAIDHLSRSLQAATGLTNKKRGYEGLVEAATMASRQFSPIQQRQVVIRTLEMAFPKPILNLIKMLLKPSKYAREWCAAFTTIFFAWLVGPCEVRESEFEGSKERNVVYIPKCRFLEGTNCVGMCTNLCKMPSQTFIQESLGMPFNMVPNFDDMSCKMIFGQEPPPESLDPAFAKPCYKQCKSPKKMHRFNCTVDTVRPLQET